MLWSFCLGKNRITHLLEVALRFSTLRSAMLTLVRAVPSVESLWSQRFLQKTTCGGASRAILRANRRTPTQSWTVVHSFVVALIYPQPCRTMHPPVATNRFERSVTGGAAHSARAFCLRKTKSDKITFSESNFLPLKKFRKQVFC